MQAHLDGAPSLRPVGEGGLGHRGGFGGGMAQGGQPQAPYPRMLLSRPRRSGHFRVACLHSTVESGGWPLVRAGSLFSCACWE